jgi:hypothetical protein
MIITRSGNVGVGTISPSTRFSVRATTATHKLVGINRANSDVAALYLGNNSSNDAIISGNNAPISLGKDVSGTYTEYVNIATDGELKFSAYGAGILKTNASGIVSVDTSTYITDVDWDDIGSINGTININSTTQIGQGDTETLVSFQNSGTERGSFEVDDSANSYFVATGFKTATASTGFLKADGTVDTGDFFSGSYSDLTGTPTLGTMAAASTGDYKTSDQTETYVGQELASYTTTSSFGTNAFTSYTDHSTQGYLTSYTETSTLADVTGRGATTTNNISVGNLTAVGGTFTDPVTIYDSTTTENPRLSVGRNSGESIQFGVTDVVNTITAKQDSDSDGDHFFVLDRVFAGSGDSIFRIHNDGTPDFTIDGDGVVTLNQYGTAGILKINTSGTISVDTNTYSTATGVADNADNYGSWTVSDGTNTESITSGTTVAWRGSGATSVSYDASTNQFSISSTDTQYSAATTSAAGLMSSTDKTKLDGIASGAEVNVQSDWNATTGDAFIKNKPTLGTASASAATDFVAVAGDTITGQVIFPSASTTKPVLPNGYIARNDNSDTDTTHDIWGISERYYPSNETDADAWGIQWSGTPNEINFIGAGQKKLSIDLDTAGTVKIDGDVVATQAYVNTAVANVVDSAPAALDTLNELAAALGDDASFSTTMSTALGNRLRVDVNNQSLTSAQKANGRTNLGLGSAATAASTAFVAVSGDTMTGNLTMSSATPTLKFSINGAENNAGIVWEDGDAGDPSAQAAAIKWDASSNHMRFYNNDEAAERMRINSDGTTTFLGTINASAGIAGLTLANGGISGTNYNITGVNQLEIADPGEGIVFKSGSSGDMTLAIVDDANDNILRFSGTTAKFDVDGELIATSITSANGIYHEGDTNTSITFSTDAISVNTGGGARINITDSTTKVNNDLIIAGGKTFSLGERFEADDNGRTVLIEGVAGGSSGEGSGRIFFSEHNSSDAAADSYGLSLYYEGNPNAQLPSGFQPNTGNATWSLRRHDNSVNGAAIMSGIRTSNNVTFSGTVTVAGRMYVSTVDANATSTTALVLGASNEIEKRTLGTNAFNSIAYLEDISPATPSVDSATVVGETIEIAFSQSTTPDVDYYQVWSAVGSSGSYGMIAHVPQEDVASSMTVIDATFNVSDTMYYRVYAVKSGIYSTAGTINKAFSSAALDVSNMSVVNLNTAYYIQYEMPDSRFVDHVEIYMDAEASAANLTRTGATLVYSGNNTSYMYKIGANDLDKYHQFWVEVVES